MTSCQAYTATDQKDYDTDDDAWVLDPRDFEVYFPTSMFAMALVFATAGGVAVYIKYMSNSAVRVARSYTTIPGDSMD